MMNGGFETLDATVISEVSSSPAANIPQGVGP